MALPPHGRLHAMAGQLRKTRDEWVTVRRSPLVSIAAAVALGAVIARLNR